MNILVNRFSKKVPKSGLLKNIATLITGASFGQILLIIASPILTRIYEPEYFGFFTIYSSILAILSIICCLRYELAIVIPEKDKDAANLLVLSVLICCLVSAIVLSFVVTLGEKFAIILGVPKLQDWLWFLPLSVLLTGIFQAFNYWNIRNRQFKRLANRQITQSIITAPTQVLTGLNANIQPGGLIIGQIGGQVISTLGLVTRTWKEDRNKIVTSFNLNSIKKNMRAYKNFPLFSLWSGLLNTASVMVPPLLLGYFFSPSVVGFYALGQRILNLPMSLIGSAVAQAFFPHASEAKKNGDLDRITFEVFKNLLSLGLVPILLILLVAPELFVLVFGESWYDAGLYVRWMSLWLLFVFISSPLSNLYLILEKQRLGLIMDLCLFISRIIVLIVGGISGNSMLTIALFGIVGAILWILNCILILNMAGVSLNTILIEIVKAVIMAIPYIVLTLVSIVFFQDSIILILSSFVSGIFFVIFQIKKLKLISKF